MSAECAVCGMDLVFTKGGDAFCIVCQQQNTIRVLRKQLFLGAQIFVNHVRNHLQPGQEVICKICGKTIDEIIKETLTRPYQGV